MGDLEAIRHAAGILDVLAGAAGAFTADCLAVIVELQRDAHDIVALFLQQRRDHRESGRHAAGGRQNAL